MKKAILFDLGNTLVRYYTRDEWPGVLEASIREVAAYLTGRDMWEGDPANLAERIAAERDEPADHSVKPLEGRLARIFGFAEDALTDEANAGMCRAFLAPTFARAQLYDDALPTLSALRARGLKTGIISNLPWGSPPEPWLEEVARHGLRDAVDVLVFCRDVGYRKPARQPVDSALYQLGLAPLECLFVGDDPRWDIAGPRGLGMDAVLLDRDGKGWAQAPDGTPCVRTLGELLEKYVPAATIRPATREDIPLLVRIIRSAFAEVAARFAITPENAPWHPAHTEPEWIAGRMDKGDQYFILEDTGEAVGCVSMELADPDTVHLKKLAVLPHARHKGHGKTLVRHVLAKAQHLGARRVTLALIADHVELQAWYEQQGFAVTEQKHHAGLSFLVTHMAKDLPRA
jgi:putative hydrolase of the HAD superfamily